MKKSKVPAKPKEKPLKLKGELNDLLKAALQPKKPSQKK